MPLFKKSPSKRIDSGDVVTIIGPEAFFHGVITVRGSLRVEGEVDGNIHEAQIVVVGKNGRVRGDVSAEHVVIGGTVRGDVVAAEELEIIVGGHLHGNIRTKKLLIEEGALFEGSCVMGGKETAKEASPREEGDQAPVRAAS